MLFSNKLAMSEARVAQLGSLLAIFGLKPEATTEEAAAVLASISTEAVAKASAAYTAQLAAAETRVAESSAQLSALGSQIAVLRAAIALPSDAAVTAESLAAHLSARHADAAARIVAASGHDALAIATGDEPPATGKSARKAELVTQFNSITDAGKRSEFWTLHRDEMLD